MSRYLIIILILLVHIPCFGQKLECGVWLPKMYVDAMMQGQNEKAGRLIRPIRSIVVKDNIVQITPFGSETRQANLLRKNERLEVTNLRQMFNLNYFKSSEVDDNTYFLSQQNDNIVLEIESPRAKEKIVFIRGIDGALFRSWEDFYLFQQIRGSYYIKGSNEKLSINLDGRIFDNENFKTLQLVKISVLGQYSIVVLEKRDGTKMEIAIKYSPTELFFYWFKDNNGDLYNIQVSESPFLVLNRI